MPTHPPSPPPFSAPYAPDDRAMAARLLQTARLDAAQEKRVDRTATRLIEAIRANDDPLGGVEDMLREFALSTKEGLALMVLAEALLRVPDDATTDRLIEDKLATGEWDTAELKSDSFLVSASAWTLGITARIIQPGETTETIIERPATPWPELRRRRERRGTVDGTAQRRRCYSPITWTVISRFRGPSNSAKMTD